MLCINQIHVTLFFPKSRFHSRSLSSWVVYAFHFFGKNNFAYMSISHLRVMYFVLIAISLIAISSSRLSTDPIAVIAEGKLLSEWKITRGASVSRHETGSARIRSRSSVFNLKYDVASATERFFTEIREHPHLRGRLSANCYKGVRTRRVISRRGEKSQRIWLAKRESRFRFKPRDTGDIYISWYVLKVSAKYPREVTSESDKKEIPLALTIGAKVFCLRCF